MSWDSGRSLRARHCSAASVGERHGARVCVGAREGDGADCDGDGASYVRSVGASVCADAGAGGGEGQRGERAQHDAARAVAAARGDRRRQVRQRRGRAGCAVLQQGERGQALPAPQRDAAARGRQSAGALAGVDALWDGNSGKGRRISRVASIWKRKSGRVHVLLLESR
eukprot:5202805-Pleurochrysis_carterae.AAC.2